MPTRLHLEILTGTYKFSKFYKLEVAVCDCSLYTWKNKWGGYKMVCIYRTSKKCYRVMHIDAWNIRDKSDLQNHSEYMSCRTLYELCRYLDTLV